MQSGTVTVKYIFSGKEGKFPGTFSFKPNTEGAQKMTISKPFFCPFYKEIHHSQFSFLSLGT